MRHSDYHGEWPFQSWGIGAREDAWCLLDFGREVTIDEMALTLRADFPHDSWWTHATVTFSDGSVEKLNFIKTDKAQTFHISSREVEWLTFGTLIKAEDESPFPALSQLEVYGRDVE
jgi:hypothetical protein